MCHDFSIALLASLLGFTSIAGAETSRPNIIWIVVEDASPHIGCYGETAIALLTIVFRLAKARIVFTAYHKTLVEEAFE